MTQDILFQILSFRARYLALLVTGENHPELALIDSNIGLILHAVGEYDISLRFLEKALALNIAYHGPRLILISTEPCSQSLLQKLEGSS